jgi:hypothetical protein
MAPQVLGTPRSPAHRERTPLWTPKSLAYSVQGKPARITTPTLAPTGWFLTYTVFDKVVGDEVERIEAVPCRRCAGENVQA